MPQNDDPMKLRDDLTWSLEIEMEKEKVKFKRSCVNRSSSMEGSEEEERRAGSLLECVKLILPWLKPREVGNISLTCKALNSMGKLMTAARSSDASTSLEKVPIPFVNTVDQQPYAFFTYSRTQIVGEIPPVEDARGCDCDGHLCESGCPCSPGECGSICLCGLECINRLTQRGVSSLLKIVKHETKGWGLHAHHSIRQGHFICEYAGELLTTKEARMRQQIYDELTLSGRFSSALLVVREHLPSRNACMRINIDATRIGNVARFINHSCDGGNLSSILVRSSGALIPRLCFFASRDIQEDEELTFSYGEIRRRTNGLQCFCGNSCCFGILPSEHT